MARRVLLVLPTGTYRASAFLTAAAKLALEVVVASEVESTLGWKHPELEVVIDLDRPDSVSEAVAGLKQADLIEAVVAADESGVMVAAHLGQALALPGNPVAAAQATRDKGLLRSRLQAAGVPQPEWALWDGDAPPVWRIFPAVLKPVDQAASRGVIRVDRPSELVAAASRIRRLLSLDPRCQQGPIVEPRQLLLESFVPGPEVAAEALVRDGKIIPLVIYDKPEPLDGPYFEESIYTVPTALSADAAQTVWSTLQNAVTAIGLRRGPVHAELRLGARTPRLIDLASRAIGGHCSAVLHFASGASLEELILRNALGDSLPNTTLMKGGYGVMMMPVPGAGWLREVAGREEALALPGVEGMEICIPVGGWVQPPPEGDRYLGFLFASGKDGAEAAEVLTKAQARLKFVIDEEAQGGR
ncbi:MAG: ATP-grasp domain-containing protein [Candidatus Dormibacteria bacterium]